jgi:hypothetical protein
VDPLIETKRTEGEPHENLTVLANEVLKAIEGHPSRTDDLRAIVCLFRDEGEGEDARHLSGIGISGYEDDAHAIAELFAALRAMFHAQGVNMDILTLANKPPKI